jgi:hypothetical protein
MESKKAESGIPVSYSLIQAGIIFQRLFQSWNSFPTRRSQIWGLCRGGGGVTGFDLSSFHLRGLLAMCSANFTNGFGFRAYCTL